MGQARYGSGILWGRVHAGKDWRRGEKRHHLFKHIFGAAHLIEPVVDQGHTDAAAPVPGNGRGGLALAPSRHQPRHGIHRQQPWWLAMWTEPLSTLPYQSQLQALPRQNDRRSGERELGSGPGPPLLPAPNSDALPASAVGALGADFIRTALEATAAWTYGDAG